jgi:hypothetical protein
MSKIKTPTVRKHNPMAKVLSDPRYSKRIVKSKRVYSRKTVKGAKNSLDYFMRLV